MSWSIIKIQQNFVFIENNFFPINQQIVINLNYTTIDLNWPQLTQLDPRSGHTGRSIRSISHISLRFFVFPHLNNNYKRICSFQRQKICNITIVGWWPLTGDDWRACARVIIIATAFAPFFTNIVKKKKQKQKKHGSP